MKKLILIVTTSIVMQLTGCSIMDSFDDIHNHEKVLEDSQGRVVLDCFEKIIPYRSNEVIEFWKKNNLPHGTTEFICKDGKAYLPNQVTDCQGNPIVNQSSGIQAFKQRNGLPLTYDNIRFVCQNGKPVQWQKQ